MSKVDFYSAKGTKKEDFSLPKDFVAETNPELLSQAIRVYQDRKHQGTAKAKTRGEVDISKRKIYRQKGTGMARHGARSAPIFVGGGVTHGPRGVKRVLSLPKKIKQKSLKIALGLKVTNKNLLVIDGLETLNKTKDGQNLINKIMADRNKKGLRTKKLTLVLSEKAKTAVLALRNINNVKPVFFKQINAEDVFIGGLIGLDRNIFAKEKKETKEKSD